MASYHVILSKIVEPVGVTVDLILFLALKLNILVAGILVVNIDIS